MAFSKNKKSKRSKKFVDRGVQGALVRRLAAHWIAFLVIGTAVSLMFQYLTDPFTGLDKHFEYFLQHQAGFIAVMLCMTPVFLYDTVKLSNRFAGPIFRLRRALKELAKGDDVERISFRPGDFWGELADDFNAVLDRHQATAATDPSEEPVQEEPELVGAAN
jgi:methyl-accepting chemotaxis protein